MWSFVLYVLAVIVGLILFWFYDDEVEECKRQEVENINTGVSNKPVENFRFSSIFAVLGLSVPGSTNEEQFDSFTEHFTSFEEVSEACWRAGLESSNLLIGVDFTASNEWKGRKSFNQNCLHKLIGNKVCNPYQKVIWILGQTLAPFDDDNLIPAFGFGDSETKGRSVFPFKYDGTACNGFQEVLEWYNEVVRRITLSGPSSFAPIINKAIEVVRDVKKYHILVIITDGQVTEESATVDAIIEASNYPLSIIAVGVGDGPWHIMERYDNRLYRRKFDNFRFVDYHKATTKSKNPDTAFALQALMEIPDQYKRIKDLGYLTVRGATFSDSSSVESSSSRHVTPVGSPAKQVIASSKGSPNLTCSRRNSPVPSSPEISPRSSPGKMSEFRHRFSNASC